MSNSCPLRTGWPGYSAASADLSPAAFRFEGIVDLRLFDFSVPFAFDPFPSMAAPMVSDTRPAADLTGSLLDAHSGRGLYLCVTEQLADHRQSFAQGEGAAGIRVPKIVDADIVETGLRPNAPPGMLQSVNRLPTIFVPVMT